MYSGALLLSVRISFAQEQESGVATISESRDGAEKHVGLVIMGVVALLTGLVALRRAVVCRKYASTKDQSDSTATPSKDVDLEACTVTPHIEQSEKQCAPSSLQAKYIQHIITSLPTGCEFVEPDEVVKATDSFAELLKLPSVSIVSEEGILRRESQAIVDPGETKSPKLGKKKLRLKTLSKQGSNGTIEHAPSKKKRVVAKVERKRVHKEHKTLDSLPVQKSLSTPSTGQSNSKFLKVPGPSPRGHLDTDSHTDQSASEDMKAYRTI